MDGLTDKDLGLINSRIVTIRKRVRELLLPHCSNDLVSEYMRISINSTIRTQSFFELWHPDGYSEAMEFAELGDVLLAAKQS
jgi:hypothetical protein